MVFNVDMAFAIELIALGVGSFLFLKSRSEKCFFTKIVSLIIIIGALLVLLCTTFNAIKLYKNKDERMMNKRFNHMMGPNGGQGMKRFQMQHQGGMQNQKGNFNNQNPQMDPNQLPPEKELEKEFEPGNTP